MANVSLVRYIPLGGNNWGSCVILQGHPAPGPNDKCFATWDRASTRFLDSIGVPMLRGRNFSAQDTATSPQVVIVNQAFVRHFFPNQDPIGKHFGIVSPENSGAFEIVGVFADFKMTDPRREVDPLFSVRSPSSSTDTRTRRQTRGKRPPCSSTSSFSTSHSRLPMSRR